MITTKEIAVSSKNLDPLTVTGFGKEWAKFDQNKLYETELGKIFNDYFRIFPWDQLRPNPIGADIGCGSGRWPRCVAPDVATDVGDCAYIIGDTGHVVPVGDVAGFASSTEVLLKLSRTQQIELSKRARARLAGLFEIGQVVRLIEELYEFLGLNS
jgi:hypothetical protein